MCVYGRAVSARAVSATRTLSCSFWVFACAQRYLEGAVLVGVSAGAIMLGQFATLGDGETRTEKEAAAAAMVRSDKDMGSLYATLALVPHLVAVHGEDDNWAGLLGLLPRLKGKRGVRVGGQEVGLYQWWESGVMEGFVHLKVGKENLGRVRSSCTTTQ